ncbi:methyltransferase family protein [Chloroflexota bacterium]
MLAFNLTLFALGTTIIFWVSRASLNILGSHGFFRFFAWETILVMFVLNSKYWFYDPFSPNQVVSWFFLVISLLLITLGVIQLRRMGNVKKERSDPGLVGLERTTKLVTTGLYRYIRHPFYSSLLFLAWGIACKSISIWEVFLAILATIFLILTARKEEIENIAFFGDEYNEYMLYTKMFIPYIF